MKTNKMMWIVSMMALMLISLVSAERVQYYISEETQKTFATEPCIDEIQSDGSILDCENEQLVIDGLNNFRSDAEYNLICQNDGVPSITQSEDKFYYVQNSVTVSNECTLTVKYITNNLFDNRNTHHKTTSNTNKIEPKPNDYLKINNHNLLKTQVSKVMKDCNTWSCVIMALK